jgi:hypothetical protein
MAKTGGGQQKDRQSGDPAGGLPTGYRCRFIIADEAAGAELAQGASATDEVIERSQKGHWP